MAGVNVKSEIKPLKKVLLHRPGKELLNLTPNTLEELLFDDIPFLKVAQAEHDAFAQALRDNGVEVVYLENLMAEVLDANPALREQFLKQFIEEAGIRTELDVRNEKIGFKIREAQMMKIPYMFVLGDKEVQDGVIAVRSRSEGSIGTMTYEQILAKMQEEVETKAL